MSIWKRYLPISFGLILSVSAVIFLLEAVRGIDFDGFEYNFYPLMNFICGLVLGLIGFPIVLSQLDKLSRDD
jgi:hypothetical protein